MANGRVAYTYRVENQSPFAIYSIQIGGQGLSGDWDEGMKTGLGIVPPGTKFGIDDRAPEDWVAAPKGWGVSFEQDEDSRINVRFGCGLPSTFVQPGQTLGGFKVILPKEHVSYSTVPFMVFLFKGGKYSNDYLQGNLEPDPASPAMRHTKAKPTPPAKKPTGKKR